MHPLAAQTVRRALAAGASIDPCEDYDAIAALDRAAQETADVPIWRQIDILDRPVIVGDPESKRGHPALLYPPSYNALEAIETFGQWWPDPCVRRNCAYAWALAFGRDPDQIRAAANPRAAWAIIKRWISGLNCGLIALFAAADHLLSAARSESPDPAADPSDPAAPVNPAILPAILARILQECGGTEEKWLYGPIHSLQAAIALIRRQDAAQASAIAKASGKPEPRDPDDPSVGAFLAWRKASDAFLKRFTPTPTIPGPPRTVRAPLVGAHPAPPAPPAGTPPPPKSVPTRP